MVGMSFALPLRPPHTDAPQVDLDFAIEATDWAMSVTASAHDAPNAFARGVLSAQRSIERSLSAHPTDPDANTAFAEYVAMYVMDTAAEWREENPAAADFATGAWRKLWDEARYDEMGKLVWDRAFTRFPELSRQYADVPTGPDALASDYFHPLLKDLLEMVFARSVRAPHSSGTPAEAASFATALAAAAAEADRMSVGEDRRLSRAYLACEPEVGDPRLTAHHLLPARPAELSRRLVRELLVADDPHISTARREQARAVGQMLVQEVVLHRFPWVGQSFSGAMGGVGRPVVSALVLGLVKLTPQQQAGAPERALAGREGLGDLLSQLQAVKHEIADVIGVKTARRHRAPAAPVALVARYLDGMLGDAAPASWGRMSSAHLAGIAVRAGTLARLDSPGLLPAQHRYFGLVEQAAVSALIHPSRGIPETVATAFERAGRGVGPAAALETALRGWMHKANNGSLPQSVSAARRQTVYVGTPGWTPPSYRITAGGPNPR